MPLRRATQQGSFTWAAAMVLVTWFALQPNGSQHKGGVDRTDPAADSLISLWIDSVGGMETYGRFIAASYTVTTVLYDTVSGRQKRSRPRYVWVRKGPYGEESRVERWETGGLIQQGFNGRDPAWAAEDGEMLPDTAKDSREALYVARDLFYWIGIPYKLRDPGVFLSYLGLKERPGADWPGGGAAAGPPDGLYHAVAVSFGEGVGEHSDVFTYYFAPGHGFPTEVTYVEEGRTNLNRMEWGKTMRAGEIEYPYVVTRTTITASGKRSKELIISDVVINLEVPQRVFEVP
ncbi:MAG: hypothetical protein ACE5HT_07320 [Gemmatimonadales bacterium]